jgi:hypothetical protein
MADHSNNSAAPDVETLAALIDESSLDSADGFMLQNDVSADMAMMLRDRIRQDQPDRRWRDLHESAHVLTQAGVVIPEFDGSFRLSRELPPGKVVIAVARNHHHLRLEPPDFPLPGGASRQQWSVYVAEPPRQHRCTLTWTSPPDEDGQRWTIEAALWWELSDPAKAAAKALTELTPQLIEQAAHPASGSAVSIPNSTGKQILFEQRMARLLFDCGITAECAIRILREGAAEPARRSTVEKSPPGPPAIPPQPPARRSAAVPPPLPRSRTPRDQEFLELLIASMTELLEDREFDEYFDSALHTFITNASGRHGRLSPQAVSLLSQHACALQESVRVAGLDVESARVLTRRAVDAVLRDSDLPEFLDLLRAGRSGQHVLRRHLVARVVTLLNEDPSILPHSGEWRRRPGMPGFLQMREDRLEYDESYV